MFHTVYQGRCVSILGGICYLHIRVCSKGYCSELVLFGCTWLYSLVLHYTQLYFISVFVQCSIIPYSTQAKVDKIFQLTQRGRYSKSFFGRALFGQLSAIRISTLILNFNINFSIKNYNYNLEKKIKF